MPGPPLVWNTTGTQVAGALGGALIGLVDAFAASGGKALRAFTLTVLLIVVLSVALSHTVLPLDGLRPAVPEKRVRVHEQEHAHEGEEETELAQSREEGSAHRSSRRPRRPTWTLSGHLAPRL
jgi:predicted lipid-binding transport protein (Tim44 family)